jgi:adenosylcobinamide kinase/adenosylcobinamide-phosphate guanylyltransferase
VLVGGGARSGKSRFALGRARSLGRRRIFLATAEALDDEMGDRIARHKAERAVDEDAGFVTWEEPLAVPERLASLSTSGRSSSSFESPDVVLLDCLTLWLSNLLVHGLLPEAAHARVGDLCEALALPGLPTVVVVTNEVGFGLVPETPLGRAFRDLAGFAHQRLAARADEVHVAILGRVLELHPGPLVARAPGHYERSTATSSDEGGA